jgi:hypothetical protein
VGSACVTLLVMRGRSLCGVTLLLVAALVGCAPAPAPSQSVTQPPTPVDFVPWPDIVWRVADLPPPPLAPPVERVVAVTATADSFVAVGYREINGVRDAVIWHSGDGEAWEAIDDQLPAGVELLDVSAAPGGMVALGTMSIVGEPPEAIVISSTDVRIWAQLAPLPDAVGTFPSSLAGDETGVLVVGDDMEGKAVVWRSLDGRAFERLPVGGPAREGVESPRVVGRGYAALGSAGTPPVLLRSPDGGSWTPTPIDQAPDLVGTRLEIGRWGWIVQGLFAPGCGPGASCVGQPLAWWSGDGTAWTRLPGEGSPLSNGASVVVPAADHGLLAVDGASAWSSPDGWAWRPLPEPGDGSVTIDDAVVRGGVIVAVGAEYAEDGSSAARILVAN